MSPVVMVSQCTFVKRGRATWPMVQESTLILNLATRNTHQTQVCLRMGCVSESPGDMIAVISLVLLRCSFLIRADVIEFDKVENV